ncbi:MAG: extracellular solute-binding protein [Defluviitaleaceae bacterium]|nr:extracellular solute-binding protein [Defluviitaleaceae bacterium]
MKKAFLLIAILLVAALMFTACSRDEEEQPAQTVQPDTQEQAAATPDPVEVEEPEVEDDRMFAETFHIRWLEEGRPHLYDDNNMVEQMLNELLNVEIEYIQIPFVQFEEQMGLILASRDLPDIINFLNLAGTAEWAMQGAIIPLDNLLESYGQDIMSHWIEDDWLRVRSATDGLIYGIPAITDVPGAFSVMYRQDMLEYLGLESPTTLDEFVAVLEAVRDGFDDVIPYAGLLRPFENAFGIRSTIWQIYNDEYVTRFTHPNYEAYLEFMVQMYADRLIDPEFFTRNTVTANIEELFFSNRAFMTEQWAAFAETATRTINEIVPEAIMISTDPILGPLGHQQIMGRSRWMSAGAISSQADRPEDLMRVLNWFFTYDGITLTNFGVEGVTFEYVNGEQRLLPDYASFIESRRVGINKAVAPIVMTSEYFFQAQLMGQTVDQISPETRLFYDGMMRNIPFIYLPAHIFTTPAFTANWTNIEQVLLDSEVQTIIGAQTIEAHLNNIARERANGLDEIKREMNEAFDMVR